MVESDSKTGDGRWPKSNWEIPVTLSLDGMPYRLPELLAIMVSKLPRCM